MSIAYTIDDMLTLLIALEDYPEAYVRAFPTDGRVTAARCLVENPEQLKRFQYRVVQRRKATDRRNQPIEPMVLYPTAQHALPYDSVRLVCACGRTSDEHKKP